LKLIIYQKLFKINILVNNVDNELQPLLIELCHLVVMRNAINTRRHRARFRKNYYANAVRVLEAHNESNYQLRKLNPAKHQAKINDILYKMTHLRLKHPRPKKWQAMGLLKLRSLVLQGEGEYAIAKHETMEFSIKNRARVRYLTKTLNCSLSYNNGSIDAVIIKEFVYPNITIRLKEIHQYAEQYELNKAVEGMLE